MSGHRRNGFRPLVRRALVTLALFALAAGSHGSRAAWAQELLGFEFTDNDISVGGNRYSPAIRSDGGGLYLAKLWEGGFVAFRTRNDLQQRSLVIDFTDKRIEGLPSNCGIDDAYGQPGSSLNICGYNLIQDVAIWVDNHPFSSNALRRGVSVTVNLNLSYDHVNWAFILKFPVRLKVSPDPADLSNPNVRILRGERADNGSVAVAELFRRHSTQNGRLVDVSLGHYYVPFQVKMTRLP